MEAFFMLFRKNHRGGVEYTPTPNRDRVDFPVKYEWLIQLVNSKLSESIFSSVSVSIVDNLYNGIRLY